MSGETLLPKGDTTSTDSLPQRRDTDEERPGLKVAAYQQAVTIRNAELQVLWVRYNIQAALNIGLLVAIMGLRQESLLARVPAVMTTGAGVLLAFMWLWTTVYGGRWLQHWERELIHLEAIIGEAEVFPLFRRAYANPPRFNGRQHYAAVTVPVLVMGVWIVLWYSGLLNSPVTPPMPAPPTYSLDAWN